MQLVVARIGRPQGLRGEVRVEVRTDDPSRRFAIGARLLTDPVAVGPLVVSAARHQSGRTILTFDGIHDRNAAEQLRGVFLLVDIDHDGTPTQDVPAGDGDEWYDHQLIGLQAVHVDGHALGELIRVEHLPAQDLLVIRPPQGGEVLVPFVSALVPAVDLPTGRVIVDPPGGLFDEGPADTEDPDDPDDPDDPANANDAGGAD